MTPRISFLRESGRMQQAVGLDRLAQPGLVRREAEEEVLLLGPLARPLVVGADVVRLAQLLLVLEALAARAVPAAVLPEVDRVPAVGRLRLAQEGPQLQDAPAMDVLGRPDEAVVADVVTVPQRAERRGDDVAVLLLGDAALARDPLDVLPVLVGAGQEEDVLPPETPRAGEGVGRDRGVGVADVRHVVDVVDRRRDDRNALRCAHRLPGLPARHAARAAASISFTATPLSAAARWQSSNSGHAL